MRHRIRLIYPAAITGLMATSKIAQHHHCRKCGKAFVGEDSYCSSTCQDSSELVLKKKKKQLLFLYAISLIIMIVAVLFLR
jgi:predicted nucleic acid-binding Zn ribbon protein